MYRRVAYILRGLLLDLLLRYVFIIPRTAATACSPPAVGRTSYAAFEEVGPRIFALRIDGCYRYGRDSGGLEEKGNVMSRLRMVLSR